MASYWTKRRKLNARVEKHVQFISEFDEADTSAISKYEVQISSEQEHIPSTSAIYANSSEFESCSKLTDERTVQNIVDSESLNNSECTLNPCENNCVDNGDGEDNEATSFESFLSDTSHLFNEDSDSDISDEIDVEVSDSNLIKSLCHWATEFRIPHSALSALLGLLHVHHDFLPKDPRTLLNTTRTYNIAEKAGGQYFHFGFSSYIEKFVTGLVRTSQDKYAGQNDVTLQINIDGLPLFKSSNTQLWPVLGRVVTPVKSEPFIIGIFCGQRKPSSISEYLEDFVSEMQKIKEGLYISEVNLWVNVLISCVICDAPARSFVKQVKGHSGYYGCDKCCQKGVWMGKMTFPETGAALRTDIQFDEMRNEEHHIGQSPFRHLQMGMLTLFPLDYMHLVCLGVVKRIVCLWMKSPVRNRCRLGTSIITQISDTLVSLQSYIPREFARKCRSLREYERWKATEFRQFLLYTGPLALFGKLNADMYNHFMLLFVGIYCLSSESLSRSHCQYANDLLKIFVEQFSELYGRDMVVYNVHCLIHLASDVKSFGPLDSFSSFPFENYLGKLKKMIRQPNFPLSQIIRRLSEQEGQKVNIKLPENQLKQLHKMGPLTFAYIDYQQYKEIHLPNVYISVFQGNNCVMINGSVALVRNIVSTADKCSVFIIYETFDNMHDFFTYPLKSSNLGIYKVSQLQGRLRVSPLSLIACKYFMLPFKQSFVCIPLLH